MKPTLILPLVASLLLAGAQAQEPGKMRAKANELIEQAQRAKSEGHPDKAEELMRQAKRLQSESRETEKPKPERAKPEAMMREIEELNRLGRHEEAEQIKRRMVAEQGHGPKQPGPIAGDRERLAHISQAIEHARVAGLREEAEHLEQIARLVKEEMGHREHGAPGGPAGADQLQGAMREMREGMEELRVRTQKMAHAIEELRDQVRALQGGAAKKKGEQ
jgi:hypothetical protein